MRTSTCAFTIKRWDETQNGDWEGGRLTRTLATKTFTGELEGSGVLEAVMLRLHGDQEGVMAYVGIERISCTLAGREGTFVVVHNTTALPGAPPGAQDGTLSILEGSGTAGLQGIRGHGAIHDEHAFTLHYELD